MDEIQPDSMERDNIREPTEDSEPYEVPFPSRAHHNPFALVKPPPGNQDFRDLSADPDHISPGSQGRKKKVSFEPVTDQGLQELVNPHPNRVATALLQQEIRGLTLGDLMGQPILRRQVRDLLLVGERNGTGAPSVNVAVGGVALRFCASGLGGQSEAAGSRLANLARSDWPDTPAPPKPDYAPQPPNSPTPYSYLLFLEEEEGKQKERGNNAKHAGLFRNGETNVLESNNAQAEHEIAGVYDTWEEGLDEITHQTAEIQERKKGLAFIQCDLPICWAYINNGAVKCLIDTGSQLNLLRMSAARALKIPYEQYFQTPDRVEGVVTANGGLDPYIGTAWNVPVKIGEVVTRTNFRIVANLTRSAILGGPWCASARLAVQYNVFGRVTCRIVSSNGERNTVFIASDPMPHHPEYMAKAPTAKESEN